jgi:hypothetical protein
MCIAVAKYFKNYGWCVAKNRDQDYVPDIIFRDRNAADVGEVLVMYDENTKYEEGMNYSGLGIISTSLTPLLSLETNNEDGKIIGKAIHMKDPKKAADYIVSKKMSGFVLVFNQEHLYLIEAACEDMGKGAYKAHIREVPHNETVAVTNHGLHFPWAGFQYGYSEKQDIWRRSSEARQKAAAVVTQKATKPEDLLTGLGQKVNSNLQMNMFRCSAKPRQMRTIFQNLLIPKHKTMYVIPIQCKLDFNTDREFVKCQVLDNKHIYDRYKGHIKHFAHIERMGDHVKCIGEEFMHFKTFLRG